MANPGSASAQKLRSLLAAPEGLAEAVAAISVEEQVNLEAPGMQEALAQNVAADLIEKSTPVKYPTLHVYCERLVNLQREKFRTFSGKAMLTAEVRVSQDRIEEIEHYLGRYVDAVTRVLEANRGDWGGGMFFGGGYEVSFGPVKRGGKNFLQAAKVSIEIDVSID